MNDDDLLFDEDDASDELPPDIIPLSNGWKILIIDDEPEVHQITKLALVNFRFENRGLEFLHAYSAAEALPILESNPDIALTLLDVVMESHHAGLDLVRKIRLELKNYCIRIVLRTGQPGLAPERDIVMNYDINDYVEKAELSAQKLFTVIVASLRGYRDILKLEKNREELILTNKHLAEQSERIQVTLDSIGDAVLTTDAKGQVTHLNPIAQSLTGWSIKEAQGQPLSKVFNIINAESRLRVENPVEKVLATGKIIGLANHTILVNKNGNEYQIADSAAPIRNDAGDVLGVVLVCRDVTQAYQTEEALRRSQKMDAIGQITGGIAHDFNNQLGVMIGYLDFLQEHNIQDQKVSNWIEICTNATLRCIDLTRQLLSFSSTQSAGKTVVSINDSLNDLETMFTRSVTPAIQIQYLLTEDLWLTEINSGDFQDATLNLVLNARDAMPEGGKLSIETANKILEEGFVTLNPGSHVGEYIQLSLSDTGDGMNKSTQEKIFEPFYTTKPKGKGTGLGMSMVYGFVNRFGGFIKIYSELGIGTSIQLYLPRAKTSQSNVFDPHKGEMNFPTGNESILIVDDELELLHLAEKFLTEMGYIVYLAENGNQAIDVFMAHSDIDLLFSDVVMPGGINGYKLADILLNKNPNLKVLLSSGFTSNTIAHESQANLNESLLNKPYRKIELAQRIRMTLDSV